MYGRFLLVLTLAVNFSCTSGDSSDDADSFVPGSLEVSLALGPDCSNAIVCPCTLYVQPDHAFQSSVPETARKGQVLIGSSATFTGMKPESKNVFFTTNADSCTFKNNSDVNAGYQTVVTIESGKTTKLCATSLDSTTLEVASCGSTSNPMLVKGCTVNLDTKQNPDGSYPKACYVYPNEASAKGQCDGIAASNPVLTPQFDNCAAGHIGICTRPNEAYTYYYNMTGGPAKANCEAESGATYSGS